ncbi:MAG: hypothetical protein LBS20_13815 [Prevotella sp.]|jgi:hypothetical protein|nr:hypothetical protein [Prevotella sp.]
MYKYEEIVKAIKERYIDRIESEKRKIIIEVKFLIETDEKLEKEAIKRKLIIKERKKELARQAKEELIKEGLITPDTPKRRKKSDG